MSIIRRRAAAKSQVFGRLRHTVCRPAGQGRREGLGERVLRSGDIAGSRSEVGYELAVAQPRRVLGCSMRGCPVGHITQIGRTSTVP